MLIADVASSGDDAARAEWIEVMFGAPRGGFAKIRGLVWFDKVDREVDWPLEGSAAASSAFARGLRGGYLENSRGFTATRFHRRAADRR